MIGKYSNIKEKIFLFFYKKIKILYDIIKKYKILYGTKYA
jgi:hypothetical protein